MAALNHQGSPASRGNGTVPPKASPFDDFEKLRAKNKAAFAGETEIGNSVKLGRPGKGLYIRCPTNPDMYVEAMVWSEDDDRKTYYIDADLWQLPDLEGGLRPAILCPWMGADGSLGLWCVSAAESDWAESARQAVAEAKRTWVRVQSVQKLNLYRLHYPLNAITDRPWPDMVLMDFCRKAFGSRVVTSEDDPLIRRLRNLDPS